MIFVERNARGEIIAIYQEERAGATEQLAHNDPSVLHFLGSTNTDLSHSDIVLIRVIEDLVDVLIQKNLLRLTDLPVAAQEKLLSRKTLRKRLSNSLDLLVDSEQGLL
ncbi:hypothetical protein HQ393_02765 [Chitinibacter bivalviorum]|uniref:Tryptophan synthase subunit beta like protein n=1 Tax=Chitinibacter bivalviorum TaxID=2739434 RepID=A0A7H9BFA9_9NEIS|nr:hypothetical protein [Chitinibacter bivalviorum]QLG87257.1 hypothetical protein HQ393_02765 [Chitinibacter bivalviorum]